MRSDWCVWSPVSPFHSIKTRGTRDSRINELQEPERDIVTTNSCKLFRMIPPNLRRYGGGTPFRPAPEALARERLPVVLAVGVEDSWAITPAV